jgi:5-oxoprolinase (ATP-hydrolysing) subunit A
MRIDLNCDMGESFGSYRIGEDDKIIPYITSANIACGYHAGDPMVMARTVALAQQHQVAVGAHPGYPDLMGYGRRSLETLPGEIRNYLLYQLGALAAFAKSMGVGLQHVKPHGALYNLTANDERAASEVIEAIRGYDPGLILVTLAGSRCAQMAADAGLRVAREAFPDRAYLTDGRLVPRTNPDAVIHDREIVRERVLGLVSRGKILTITGSEIGLEVDTLCIHGDTSHSWEVAAALRQALETTGIQVIAMGQPTR